MIERKERKPYWRHTKWQMLASLIPFLVVLVVLPLYADGLNHNKFLGFPLGYLLAAHGLFLIALITVGGIRQPPGCNRPLARGPRGQLARR